MKKKIFALLALAMTTMTASAIDGYDLTVGTNEHGTVKFKVGGTEVSNALEGDEVTVIVKAGKGWKSKDLTARAYTSFDGIKSPRRDAPNIEVLDWLTVTPSAGVDSAYTFTMPAANVEVNAGYDRRALTNEMIQAIPKQLWTGSPLTPTLVVTDRDYTLVKDVDYTVSYANNTNKGVNTATATITAKTDLADHYIGTASATFTICKEISYANGFLAYAVSDDEHPIIYTGDPLEPEVVVREGRVVLQEDVDSTLEYSDNITATSPGQVTVKGIGMYTGELTSYFTINTRDLSSEMISPVTGIVYDGTAQYPKQTITFNGRQLVEGDDTNPLVCDYYTTYLSNTDAGTATLTITTMMQEHKNFKKQAENITYTITVAAKEITDDNVTVGEVGENGVPEITVSVEAPVGTLTPQEGTDYQLAYYDNPVDRNAVTVEQMNAAPGDYVAVLTFFGNYIGFVEKTITVTDGGEVTGISTVGNGKQAIGNAYDLSGRRVAQPTKGVYIRNGKKVVVK